MRALQVGKYIAVNLHEVSKRLPEVKCAGFKFVQSEMLEFYAEQTNGCIFMSTAGTESAMEKHSGTYLVVVKNTNAGQDVFSQRTHVYVFFNEAIYRMILDQYIPHAPIVNDNV